MMNFNDYVVNWWREVVDNHADGGAWCEAMMEEMGYSPASDYLDEDNTPYDFLSALDDGAEIFEKVFGYNSKTNLIDETVHTEVFVEELLTQAAAPYAKEYDFVQPLVSDMAGNCVGYDTPFGFFKDLATGGCASGMVGMFIYHDSCKKFYIDHIDSMENYIEDLEYELGSPIQNRDHQPRYTWVCWLCYEELGYNIARNLFEDKF